LLQRFIAGSVLVVVGVLILVSGRRDPAILALSWMLIACGVIVMVIGLKEWR
jgi:hypothetical protein